MFDLTINSGPRECDIVKQAMAASGNAQAFLCV
jgi:hypothetical protein